MNKKAVSLLKALCVFVIFAGCFLGLSRLTKLFAWPTDTLRSVVFRLLIMAILVVTAAVLHMLGIFRFTWKSFRHGCVVGLFFVIYIVFQFVTGFFSAFKTGGALIPVSEIILHILDIVIGVGFIEEVMFRGIILNLIADGFGRDKKSSFMIAILISSVLFGFMHFGNLLTAGSQFSGVLVQVISTIGTGTMLGAIYVRCGNIWLMSLLHGLYDFALFVPSLWQTSQTNMAEDISSYSFNPVTIAVFVIEVMVFLFLMRKKRSGDYLHTACSNKQEEKQ